MLILTGAFWFDATLTLYRRWRRHEKLSEAHKKHAYQRITQAGFSHQKTVLFVLALNSILGILAFLASIYNSYLLVFFIIAIVMLYIAVKYVDRKKAFEN